MMAAVRSQDSRAELLLRRALHAKGLRYRLHARDLPGRPDIVFRRNHVAVFVDGDLWHGNAWRVRGLAALSDLFPTRTDWVGRQINPEHGSGPSGQSSTRGNWLVGPTLWKSDVLKDTAAAAEVVLTGWETGLGPHDRYNLARAVRIEPTARRSALAVAGIVKQLAQYENQTPP